MDYLKFIFEDWYIGILFLVYVGVFLIQLFYYIHYYSIIIRRNKKERKHAITFSDDQPGVSVILCARNEERNLEQFLPLFLEQKYPNYEVIVVNDGSWDDTEEVLKKFSKLYPHLYYTSIPEETKIISRKKLAITVGIKAAKHDLLLFSDADCRPQSPQWISGMVRNYTADTEFVLGYGGYIYQSKSLLNKMINYDTQFIAMQYLGFANNGLPYMAVGRNLSYRKDTFFKNKGFAGNLHLTSGDDDLLVNRAANNHNVNIETSLNAITLSIPKESFKDWFRQKYRHLTASSSYSSKSKCQISIEPITRLLFYFCFILLCCTTPIYGLSIAILVFVMRYLVQCLIYNRTAKLWKSPKFYLSIILFDILLPCITLFLLVFGKFIYKSRRSRW